MGEFRTIAGQNANPWEEFALTSVRVIEGAILEEIEARQKSEWQRGVAW